MRFKIHLFDTYLDFSPDNQEAVNDEHGERSQQDIAETKVNGAQTFWQISIVYSREIFQKLNIQGSPEIDFFL